MRSMRLVPLVAVAAAYTVRLNQRAPETWTYQGCYLDSTSDRQLAYSSGTDYDDQTVETCTTWCGSNGYDVAGLEYGRECWCDYQLTGPTKEPESDCSMPCSGNSTQVCGNGNRLSVYSNGNIAPTTNPGPPGWTYLACYTDNGNARTLQDFQSIPQGGNDMTVAECTTACQSAGYTLAGLEYSSQCFCDDSIQNGATIAQSGCDMTCSGNQTEYCGGPDRLNVYQSKSSSNAVADKAPAGWTTLGCFTDDVNNRTLGVGTSVPGGASNMTIEGCLSACSNHGYSFGGVEYAQECYCDNSLQHGGVCAADQTTCYQPCTGNTNEICGGPNRLNLYYAGANSPVAPCAAGGSSSMMNGSTTMSSSTSTSSATTLAVTSSSSSSVMASTPTSSSSSSSSVSWSSPAPTTSSTSTSTSTSSTSTSSSSTSSCVAPTYTTCPSFWQNVVNDLAPLMRSNGQCTDMARAAIRYAFHDSATFSNSLPSYPPASGGADGSLLLSGEIDRPINAGLLAYHQNLTQLYAHYQSLYPTIGAADLIQFVGALGVKACPLGAIGNVYVGRCDTTQQSPDGLLPQPFGNGSDHDTIYKLFQDKGFVAADIAALVGAHTTAFANFQSSNGIPAGTPLDTTPGTWDVLYYNETLYPVSGMARLESDINLSKDPSSAVGKQWRTFVGQQGAWQAQFRSAFGTLQLMGIPYNFQYNMVDCTSVLYAPPFGS